VVVDDQGKDVAEWESVFQMSDGCIVFLEAKYRMTLAHVNKQSKRMSRRAFRQYCSWQDIFGMMMNPVFPLHISLNLCNGKDLSVYGFRAAIVDSCQTSFWPSSYYNHHVQVSWAN